MSHYTLTVSQVQNLRCLSVKKLVTRKNASLIAAVGVLVIVVFIAWKLMSSTPLIVVEGISMLPTLYTGDIVVVYKPSPEEIKTGDIIVYKSPIHNKLVIHRVIKIVKCETGYCYITKGDNNLRADNEIGLQPRHGIDYEHIVGVVLGIRVGNMTSPIRIPYLGLLTILFR